MFAPSLAESSACISTRASRAQRRSDINGSKGDSFPTELTSDYEEDDEEQTGYASHWEAPPKPPLERVKQRSRFQRVAAACKKLSIMLEMPLDIQLEIMSWLTPRDLISVIRTTKGFRQLMLGKNSIRVWKVSREREEVPEPPLAWSEPRWAVLLFDGTRCEICATPGVLDINFSLLRRVCFSCRNVNLVAGPKFEQFFPEYDDAILEMIPYAHGSRYRARSTRPRLYWKPDVQDIAARWAELQDGIHRRIPGARKKASDFRRARRDLVESIIKNVSQYTTWHAQQRDKRTNENKRLCDSRREGVIRRFEELGYDAADITRVTWRKEVTQSSELTDRIWKRIRPILEPDIQKARNARVAGIRRQEFDGVYTEYMRRLAPREWVHHPSAADVLDFPAIKAGLEGNWDIEMTVFDYEELTLQIPVLVAIWQEERKAALRNKVLSFKRKYGPAGITRASSLSEPVDLATSIFRCNGWSCQRFVSGKGRSHANLWFGWEGVILHSCRNLWDVNCGRNAPMEFEIPMEAVKIATSLVILAGLDPETATIDDMDRSGSKYFCTSCPQRKGLVHDWRSAVTHGTCRDHQDSIPAVWRRLNDDELEKVIPLDDSRYFARYWGCSRCNIHFKNYDFLPLVQEHVREIHGINEPTQREDIIFFHDRLSYEPPMQLCPLIHDASEITHE